MMLPGNFVKAGGKNCFQDQTTAAIKTPAGKRGRNLPGKGRKM